MVTETTNKNGSFVTTNGDKNSEQTKTGTRGAGFGVSFGRNTLKKHSPTESGNKANGIARNKFNQR